MSKTSHWLSITLQLSSGVCALVSAAMLIALAYDRPGEIISNKEVRLVIEMFASILAGVAAYGATVFLIFIAKLEKSDAVAIGAATGVAILAVVLVLAVTLAWLPYVLPLLISA